MMFTNSDEWYNRIDGDENMMIRGWLIWLKIIPYNDEDIIIKKGSLIIIIIICIYLIHIVIIIVVLVFISEVLYNTMQCNRR